MREFKLKITDWTPVLIKGTCWIVSAMLVSFLGQTEHMTPDKLATWTWVDYIKLPTSIFYAGLVTMMAFMDQIIASHREKLESEGKIHQKPIVTVEPAKELTEPKPGVN